MTGSVPAVLTEGGLFQEYSLEIEIRGSFLTY